MSRVSSMNPTHPTHPTHPAGASHSAAPSLAGRRVLVVEDEYFIADDLRHQLEACGAEVLGPVPRVGEALALIAATPEIDALWAQIPPERFQETMTAFGQYTAPLYDLLLYCIDNEVHHRGQGYVYLRALGVEPPPFWERT